MELRRPYNLFPYTLPVLASKTAVGATLTPIFALRKKTGEDDFIAVLNRISVCAINSRDVYWQVLFNATITGSTWVDVGNQSKVQYHLESGLSYTGGIPIASGVFANEVSSTLVQFEGNLSFYGDKYEDSTNMIFLARKLGTTDLDVAATVDWLEQII